MSSEISKVEQSTPPLSEDTVRDILEREAGLKFIVPRKFELPETYNFRALEGIGVSEESLQRSINLFLNYLKDFIIIDPEYQLDGDKKQSSDKNAERVRQRKELIEKFGRIAENLLFHNQLRHNRVSAIQSQFEKWEIRSGLPEFQNWPHTALIQKFNSAFPTEIFKAWDELPIGKKRVLVEKIEDIIVKFLHWCGATKERK